MLPQIYEHKWSGAELLFFLRILEPRRAVESSRAAAPCCLSLSLSLSLPLSLSPPSPILSWAKRVAMDPPLLEWVAQAWSREVDQPSPPGKPRGPIALIVTQLRRLGWEPTEPGLWHQGAKPRSVRDLERLRDHLDQALALSRWESLATRRREFAGAEDGIDQEASFREPRKALDARKNTTFGKYACILSGGTWARDRHSRTGFDVDPCCPVCQDTKETPLHRWWVCPKWDVLRSPEGRKLAILGAATDWQPKCLWERGLLPAPPPGDCPPNPPKECNCGKPKQRRLPGKCLIYTDASAMRPKDPYLRRTACAFWAGDHESDPAAWTLPGPVQTAYRAELFAVFIAPEVFRKDMEIVSDCKGVVDEAERIRAGGKVSPTSRHTDLWARYRDALKGPRHPAGPCALGPLP